MATKVIHPTQDEVEACLPGLVGELKRMREGMQGEEAEWFDILVGAAVHYAQWGPGGSGRGGQPWSDQSGSGVSGQGGGVSGQGQGGVSGQGQGGVPGQGGGVPGQGGVSGKGVSGKRGVSGQGGVSGQSGESGRGKRPTG